MKSYFEKIQKIGLDGIAELRQLGARHNAMNNRLYEQVVAGEITDNYYKKKLKENEAAYEKRKSELRGDVAKVRADFDAFTDEYMMPTGVALNTADMEILKHFQLSIAEFDRLTEKYKHNPTMGRLLEDYRNKHDVKTTWRYQTTQERKDVFRSACSSIESILGQDDRISPDREFKVMQRTSSAYHQIQGSDPNVMPVPVPEKEPEKPRGYASLF